MKNYIIGLIFLFPLVAFSNPCLKGNNLARESWAVRTDVPVLDQSYTNMCGAFAAASFIDIWRLWQLPDYTKIKKVDIPLHIKNTSQKIKSMGDLKIRNRIALSSPYWMGFLGKVNESARKKKEGLSNLEYTSGELAVDTILRGFDSICREDVLQDTLDRYTLKEVLKRGERLSMKEFYIFSRWIFDVHDNDFIAKMARYKRNKPSNQVINDEVFTFYLEEKPSKLSLFIGDQLEDIFEKIDLRKVYFSMAGALKSKNYLSFFSKFFYRCQIRGNKYDELGKDKMAGYELCVMDKSYGKENILNKILTNLQKKNPVVYNDGEHQMVVIGNRFKRNRCELLVQNSFGKKECRARKCLKDRWGNIIGEWRRPKVFNKLESIYYIDKKGTCPSL